MENNTAAEIQVIRVCCYPNSLDWGNGRMYMSQQFQSSIVFWCDFLIFSRVQELPVGTWAVNYTNLIRNHSNNRKLFICRLGLLWELIVVNLSFWVISMWRLGPPSKYHTQRKIQFRLHSPCMGFLSIVLHYIVLTEVLCALFVVL